MTHSAHKFDGVMVTPLRQVFHPKGDIFHGLKASEASFKKFGEAYFTSIVAGEVKGWKRHNVMTMNLVVPVGGVVFYLHREETGETLNVEAGVDNYVRLTVPPGLWMAFKGGDNPLNLVLNVASIEHDYSESDNVPLETYPLGV